MGCVSSKDAPSASTLTEAADKSNVKEKVVDLSEELSKATTSEKHVQESFEDTVEQAKTLSSEQIQSAAQPEIVASDVIEELKTSSAEQIQSAAQPEIVASDVIEEVKTSSAEQIQSAAQPEIVAFEEVKTSSSEPVQIAAQSEIVASEVSALEESVGEKGVVLVSEVAVAATVEEVKQQIEVTENSAINQVEAVVEISDEIGKAEEDGEVTDDESEKTDSEKTESEKMDSEKTSQPRTISKLPTEICSEPTCENKATKACARCVSVAYCSKECQVKHWKDPVKSHKMNCNP